MWLSDANTEDNETWWYKHGGFLIGENIDISLRNGSDMSLGVYLDDAK